jgi:DnaJ family protein A protein 5
MTTPASGSAVQCYYEILSIPLNADAKEIKKAHRKLALKYHPDKNINDDTAADTFRLVQQAYEVLSDPSEKKWYDEHRDAILKGWSSGGGDNGADLDILFDITPYMFPAAYSGYGDDEEGFFAVYRMVFTNIYEGENQGGYQDDEENGASSHRLPEDFGSSTTEWDQVAIFYQSWESFTSSLNFAWEDKYDTMEAPSRRVKRAMEEENRKARRAAKKTRNEDILALIKFCKRRDPRVLEYIRKTEEEKEIKAKEQKEEAVRKRKEALEARELWRLQSSGAMAAAEEEDRVRGRVRLADLEDDYDYGGRKGNKGKKQNKKKGVESEEEEMPEDEEAVEVDNNANGSENDEESPEVGANETDSKEAESWGKKGKRVKKKNNNADGNEKGDESSKQAQEGEVGANEKEWWQEAAINEAKSDWGKKGKKGKKKNFNADENEKSAEAPKQAQEREVGAIKTESKQAYINETKSEVRGKKGKRGKKKNEIDEPEPKEPHVNEIKPKVLSRKEKRDKKKNKNKAVEPEEKEIPKEEEAAEIGSNADGDEKGEESPSANETESKQANFNETESQDPAQEEEVGANATDSKEADVNDAAAEEESDFDDESESEEEDDEPCFWRCECCHKEFQSKGQMENHGQSKKHKEAWKKYEKKRAELDQKIMEELLNEAEIKD